MASSLFKVRAVPAVSGRRARLPLPVILMVLSVTAVTLSACRAKLPVAELPKSILASLPNLSSLPLTATSAPLPCIAMTAPSAKATCWPPVNDSLALSPAACSCALSPKETLSSAATVILASSPLTVRLFSAAIVNLCPLISTWVLSPAIVKAPSTATPFCPSTCTDFVRLPSSKCTCPLVLTSSPLKPTRPLFSVA